MYLHNQKLMNLQKNYRKIPGLTINCFVIYFLSYFFIYYNYFFSDLLYFNQDKEFIKSTYNNTNVSMTNNEFYIFFNNYISKLNYERGVNMIANDYNYILPDKN